MDQHLRVAVLMGGPSGEHDISLKSGQGVTDALRRRGVFAEPLIIPKVGSRGTACAFVSSSLQQQRPDVVFIALHGAFGEDGTVQQLCENLHLPYTGSDARASRLGMDKVASRRVFEEAGIAVPRWQIVNLREARSWKLEAGSKCQHPQLPAPSSQLPMIVKPVREGSSLGVSLVRRPEEFGPALRMAGQYGGEALIEEYIVGREVTVGILGEEPLPVVEIRPHQGWFDFAAKYTAGMTEYLVPAPLPPSVAEASQAAGLAAHRVLGCRHVSRADILLRNDQQPVVLEINTIPGFTPTSLLPKAAACAGISYDELCEQLVMMAWQKNIERHQAYSRA
ncbi:MAG: D-alanine--D-alanine ligase [Candidatus Omnitrophica bacterium]|nr:D-alanine--D-alanine ligase [Candidatus Omnitrophota bacterium]